MTPETRDLISRMADELDHYRQLVTDNRQELHSLAAEARNFLARSEWQHLPAIPEVPQ